MLVLNASDHEFGCVLKVLLERAHAHAAIFRALHFQTVPDLLLLNLLG